MRNWSLAFPLALATLAAACADDTSTSATDVGDTGEVAPDLDAGGPDVSDEADLTDADIGDLLGDPDLGGPDASEVFEVSDGTDADADAELDVPPDYPPGPPELLFTVSELPAEMNGSLPYTDHGGPPTEFTVAVPTWGFTLDLFADRPPAGLDADTLEVTCDQPFGPDDDLPADSDLAAEFTWEPERVRWLVPESLRLAEGRVTCEARVANLDGEVSDWSSVTFDAVELTAARDPFDEIDPWVVTFSRDRYDIALTIDGADYVVTADLVEGGDGEADFAEDLRLIGFQGDESGAGAATLEARGAVGVNAVVQAWVIGETMRQVREYYGVSALTGGPEDEDAVRVQLYVEGDPGAPDPAAFDGTFSIHGVGGDSSPEEPTQFGRASAVDVYNLSEQNDSQLGYGSFTTNVFRLVLSQPAGRFLLREFVPGDGTPLGELDVDATILSEGFDPRTATQGERVRYNQLTFAMGLLTKALASLVAHEIGHSLGLVACGAPPYGLFSGIYDPSFMESDPGCGHIDTEGLNIMQTGGSLLANPGDLTGDVRFGPLSRAYLRRRVVLVR